MVKHPAWKISRCNNCDRNYDRNRLASLAITLRGVDLCGDPFPASASATWQSMKDEYLYRGGIDLRSLKQVRLRLPTPRTRQVHYIAQCFENGKESRPLLL
ncbi:MAG: hypothetical protein M1529_00355 [Candidatus Thermoplasmatota archaeon]|nr:hypothetical protein [Candidatus Thermoplasmatota archaeon]